MIQKRPKDFVEFHEGEKEFCPESGPLKSKKISAPSAAIAALVTSIATAATVYTLVVAPVFAFIPELISVVANVAKIETRIENLPEEASVVYNLSLEENPKEIVLSGEIYKSKDQLEFSNLKYDTDYVVKFYLKENKSKEFLKEIKFRTGKEVIDNPQDPIVPEQPEIPNEPEIPEQPFVPKPPIKPETPEQPVVPNPPVEPEVPEEPEIPETPVTEITVVGADYNGAQAYMNNDTFAGYIMQETHIFENVPSNEYTIQITQDGEITTYNDVYDESTQTVTVSFSGNAISFGETSMSNVVLIYKDGASATSTNTITTPKLNAVAIAVTDNQDGTFTYAVNGEGVDPSIGTIALEMNVYSDYYELANNPEVQTKVVNSMTFNDMFESSPIAPGKTLTAVVQANAVWSLDETNSKQVVDAEKEYAILSAPQVVSTTIDGAETVLNDEEEIEGYIVEETHVFGNVPSDEYTIQITQNGEVTVYSNVYDEETQTATITFKGNTIGLGETGTSEVVLTYKDGVSATSTNSVITPKLETVSIEVTDNQDGSYTYTMNGTGIEPSIGNVEVNVLALNDINNLSANPVTQTYTMNSANFTQAFTSHVDAYGETLTAVVEVELIWSLDEIGIGQFMMDEVDYRIDDISELTFTDVANVDGYAFSYTVNAKFANLLNATPVSMDMYIQTYNTLFNEVYEEELATTLDTSQIVKDDNGNITASYISDYLLGSEQDGHKWRIVLTYVDATNTTQTMEITNHIEPFDPVFNHLNSIMWQENGITYAEYEQVFSLSPTLTLKDVALVDADVSGWDVLSSEVEITDGFGYIRGLMSTDAQNGLELHAYLDWLATEYEEMIYTGCAGAGYMESSRTNQQLVPNSTNAGYDEVIEEFTFVDGTSMLDDFGQQHVLVTLADGSQIKVTQTEADSTGTVTVNWNDNNNIVVTVHQANVAIGQSTVVDFVYEMVRDEPEMMGEVNHYTYRCFSNYE